MSRRAVLIVASALLAALAALGLWRAATPVERSDDERARRVAATLRCPSCEGESAADSAAPLAASMRSVIGQQVAAGRTDAEIRRWFVRRYGDAVLLEPPARGTRGLLYTLPVLAFAAGAGAVLVRRPRIPVRSGGRRWLLAGSLTACAAVGVGVAGAVVSTPESHSAGAPGPPPASSETPDLAALRAAAAAAPSRLDAQLALGRALEQAGRVGDAVAAYRTAHRVDPANTGVSLRLAFALIRTRKPGEAEGLARAVLATRADNPDALLLLGLAERAQGRPAWRADLERFLTLAPRHPAAAEVTRLVADGPP